MVKVKDRSTEILERGLEGSWRPVAAYVAHQQLEVGELRVARFDLRSGRYEIRDRDERLLDSGGYSVDAAVLPLAMDLCGKDGPYAGRTLAAIFELDVDSLVICYDLDGHARPESMVPEEEQLLLRIHYVREERRAS